MTRKISNMVFADSAGCQTANLTVLATDTTAGTSVPVVLLYHDAVILGSPLLDFLCDPDFPRRTGKIVARLCGLCLVCWFAYAAEKGGYAVEQRAVFTGQAHWAPYARRQCDLVYTRRRESPDESEAKGISRALGRAR